MRTLDVRRLTGPNLQTQGCAAIAEIAFDTGDDEHAVVAAWRQAMEDVRASLPFSLGNLSVRQFPGGAALLCEPDIDTLYSAVAVLEWSLESVAARLNQGSEPSWEEALHEILATLHEEQCPKMCALRDAAKGRGVPFLWDDDEVSIGYGAFSTTWPRDALPSVEEVEWSAFKAIPVVVVTGTNGKTTTSRIAARIFKEAGHVVGNSSTDGLSIDEHIVDEGDWTGPGAARAILRHRDVTAAVLEAARGGILRRGLGVTSCDASYVTNVSDDHLGEYGIVDVDGMAEVKCVVFDIARDAGTQVFNLDDTRLALRAEVGSTSAIFIATRPCSKLRSHIERGERALFWEQGAVHVAHHGVTRQLLRAEDFPLSRGGAAYHDIRNALGAAALAWAAGVGWDAIVSALRSFGRKPTDNPGRGRTLSIRGVSVLLDFGHNPHGVDAILSMVRTLAGPDARLAVTVAQAGDRNDEAFQDLATTIAKFEPHRVFIRDLPEKYWRGRNPEEMFHLFAEPLVDKGLPDSAIVRTDGELDALDMAMMWAQQGDWVVHLVHLEREAVEAWIADAVGSH